jgi:hypothetical protein
MSEQDPAEFNIENTLDPLDDLDKAILRLKINGETDVDIARKTGRNRGTISNRQQKVKFQHALMELQKEPLEIILNTQKEAAYELRRILQESTDENKIKAAKEVLKGVLTETVLINANIKAEATYNLNVRELTEQELLQEIQEIKGIKHE